MSQVFSPKNNNYTNPGGGEGVSSVSMVAFLMRWRLRLPSRIVSTGSKPVQIQRVTVV